MRRHHLRIRERSTPTARPRLKWLAATCVGAGSLACAGAASAQGIDANPPIPDVMLILDTSGSMELMMDGCNTDTGLFADGKTGGGCCYNGTACEIPCVAVGSSCTTAQVAAGGAANGYCDGVSPRTPNRWATQVQALAGSFLNNAGSGLNYSCLSMPRSIGSSFANEFSYQYGSSTVSPYDLNYYLNYHRPVEPISPSGGGPATSVCAFGFQQGATPAWNPSDATGAGTLHQENPTSGSPDFTYAQIQGYQYNFSTSAQTMTPVNPSPATNATCSFTQAEDGLIDYGLNTIRFGMMTIDSDPAPNTGVQAPITDNASLNLSFTDVPNLGASSNLTTGMWSYYNGWELASATNNWGTGAPGSGASVGRPAGCSELGVGQISFEVGARNPAAPPWEGRMIRFPPSAVSSPAANNLQIAQAIDVMRPYGSNPIAGLMDDAKYYFWQDPEGPNGSSGTDSLNACRPQYIILFSHAAPNEDLEPYCQGGSGASTGMCPYDYPEYIAAGLAKGSYTQGQGVVNAQSASASGPNNSTSGGYIKTFVVGFALDSQLGDAGETASCKQVLTGGTVGDSGVLTGQTVNTSAAFCGTPGINGADSGTPGNPVYASCCALARIAVAGGTGAPYFADNQADLNVALQNILAIIVANTTTRATPVVLPLTASSNSGTNVPGLFVSSFAASTGAAWSGDVQRERYICPEPTAPAAPYQPVTASAGDDFQTNLNNSGGQTRHVIMVEPSQITGSGGTSTTTPSATIRPYVKGQSGTPPTAYDGYGIYDGTEWGYDYKATGVNATQFLSGSPTITTGITTNALFPSETSSSVKGCSYSQPGMTLNDADCEIMALGWLLGMQAPPADWNTSLGVNYPNRYYTGNVNSPSPMGGVYHSTPAIATPPSALLRDDSYQSFSQYYTSQYATYGSGPTSEPRHTVLYVATTDGLLHAFGVDYNYNSATSSGDPYTFIGSGHATEGGTSGTQNEMWSFVPPAVLPLLMNSVGGGESVLLDGAPVVKDTVYQRTAVGSGSDWHTTLVAGFGQAMGGYYALDVTDPSFADRGSSPTSFGPAVHTGTNSNTPPTTGSGGYMAHQQGPGALTPPGGLMPQGPHFLWQLMDSNLFATTGGTPAITTVSVNDPSSPTHALTEIGVAILPGGASTPATSGTCQRVSCNSGVGGCTAGGIKISDASPPHGAPAGQFALGSYVRQWNTTSCPGTVPSGSANPALTASGATQNPARGRSLTIVRLDTGEVLRTFTVLTDIPSSFALYGANGSAPTYSKNTMGYYYSGRVTEAEFDSPISGTPVPYPSDVGAIAQRVFVGDQDGTIWRLDVSNPDPNQWFVEPFIDAYNTTADTSATAALDRQPIVGAPALSIGRDGNVVLNFGTGDANYIGTETNPNFVYSVSELPPQAVGSSATRLIASVNWYNQFPVGGEMVTGPGAVFDGTYYFAAFSPSSTSSCTAGNGYIWGMDYMIPGDSQGNADPGLTSPKNGGAYKMTPGTASDPACTTNNQTLSNCNLVPGGAIIPGVTITSSLSCSTPSAITDPATGGPVLSSSNSTPPTYSISALQGKTGSTSNAAVSQVNIAASVHSSTLIDSWAAIVE